MFYMPAINVAVMLWLYTLVHSTVGGTAILDITEIDVITESLRAALSKQDNSG